MLRSRRFVLGLAMSALFIGLFLYRVDLEEMWRALASADYRFIAPAVLFYLVSMGWRSLRWRTILRPLGRFPVSRVWPVIIVGYAANNLLPVRLGELVRAYYLGEREGVSKTAALATILVERTFDGLVLMFLAAVVSLFMPLTGLFRGLGEQAHVNWLVLTLGLSVPFGVVGGGIVALAVWPGRAGRLLARILGVLPGRLRNRALGLVASFIGGLSALRTPGGVITIFLLSLSVWLSEAMVYVVLAFGFDIDVAFGHWLTMAGVLVVAVATSNLGTAVPSSGGGIGPFEFFAQATLIFFGVGAATASAYAVVLHATMLVPVTLLGLVYLWVGDLSLMRLATASQGDGGSGTTLQPSRLREGGSQ